MNALEELAQPRGPFPSPGSLRGLLWVLGALLWLGAWTLWYRRRPKTPRGDRASPLQEALARLRELEGREREGLDREESHLLAVELGGILRRYFEARLRKPCLGLPQEKLLLLVRAQNQGWAETLGPLLAKWEGVVYARQPWEHQERQMDLEVLRAFLSGLEAGEK